MNKPQARPRQKRNDIRKGDAVAYVRIGTKQLVQNEESPFDSWKGQVIFIFTKRPGWLWGPPSPLMGIRSYFYALKACIGKTILEHYLKNKALGWGLG